MHKQLNRYLNYICWLLAGIIFLSSTKRRVEHVRIVSTLQNYNTKDKSNTILCITNESTDSCTCSVIICHTKMAHDNHILCHQLWVMWYCPESLYHHSYRPRDYTAVVTAQELWARCIGGKKRTRTNGYDDKILCRKKERLF